MQYLLSELEYNELKDAVVEANVQKKKEINDLCIQIAMYKPIVTWLNDGKPTPWGCYHAPCHVDCEGDSDCDLPGCECDNYTVYCDECSVKKSCTLSKHWSQ